VIAQQLVASSRGRYTTMYSRAPSGNAGAHLAVNPRVPDHRVMKGRVRLVAIWVLLTCLPLQVLAGIDGPLCSDDLQSRASTTEAIAVNAAHHASATDPHEQGDVGGVMLDLCGFCHLGCAWVALPAPIVATIVVVRDRPESREARSIPDAPIPPLRRPPKTSPA
jgi:hypothetical protein